MATLDPDIATHGTAAQIVARVRELAAQGTPEAALAQCLSGLENFPANEHLWQFRLNLLRRLGRLDEALSVADDTSPASARARATPFFQRLAFDTCLDLGDLAGCRRRLRLFALADPGKGAAYLLCLARLALADPADQGGLEEILPRLAEFIDHVDLNRAVADLLVHVGRHAEACDLLARVWQHTGRAEVLAQRARLVADRDGAAAGGAILEQNAHRLPDAPWLWQLRLTLAERAGDPSAVAELAAAAARALPGNVPVRRQCWTLMVAAGQTDTVQAQAEALARDGRQPMELRIAATETCLSLASDQTGLALAEHLADEVPDNLAAVRLAALAALEKGRDASRALDRIAGTEARLSSRQYAHETQALVHLKAQALNQFGFPKRAIELLQPLQDSGALRWRGVTVLASCLIRFGRFADAEAMLVRPPKDAVADFARLRADCALGRGDLRAAQDCLTRSATGDTPHLGILRSLLRLQILAGDYAAAGRTYEMDMKIQAARNRGHRSQVRYRRSLLGQIVNEIRLKYGDRDRVGLRWDNEGLETSTRLWREDLTEDPGNTPAAFALLSALFRTGRLHAPTLRPDAEEPIPRVISQFWDHPEPPVQVADLMQWNRDMNPGYEVCRFDDAGALDYLQAHGETDAVQAYVLSRHVAARSDIFRLARLWHDGGVWLDADDRCTAPLETLIDHGQRFVGYQEVYGTVGNNFMAVRPRDPIIRAALDDAARSMLDSAGAPIWLSSGPGAVTRALALHGTTPEGTLAPGITLMAQHQLLQAVSPHVRLNYKGTASHWVRQMQESSS